MNRSQVIAMILTCAAALSCQPASAVGAAGSVGQTRPNASGAPQAPLQSEPAAQFNHGVVTALSAQGDHVEIQGRPHFIAAGRTRFYRNGQVVTAGALKMGQALRFTLVPGLKSRPVLGVVHVP
jgi:hypothetical protein